MDDDAVEATVTRGMSEVRLCFATARGDLRYLIEEACVLEETSTDEQLARHHDAIERAMELIRDLPANGGRECVNCPNPATAGSNACSDCLDAHNESAGASPDPEGAVASEVAPETTASREAEE